MIHDYATYHNDNLKPTCVWVFWYKQTCTI